MARRDTSIEREAIVRAAAELGIDPSVALAIAERESSFNPRARNSKTIEGLFQMRGDNRARYGYTPDPDGQVRAWGRFFRDVKREMAGPLGRDPTDAEGYLGHHFGGVRAGRMMKMAPDTPVDAVFTPREMRENPHFAKAGTVGALNSSILADISRRQAKFGGQLPAAGMIDFAAFGEPVDGFEVTSQAPDFAAFGDNAAASDQGANLNMGSEPAASSAPDFSSFGVPA